MNNIFNITYVHIDSGVFWDTSIMQCHCVGVTRRLCNCCRYDSNSGGEREIQRTMLELLNQLDGFDSKGDVKVGTHPRYLNCYCSVDLGQNSLARCSSQSKHQPCVEEV